MENTKHTKRKKILIGLSVLGTGVIGVLGWNYFKKKKVNENSDASSFIPYSTNNSTAVSNDNFPLKKGSKGKRVTQLQNALVKKYGASILPKYGMDGMFGKEVEAALVRAKLPTLLYETAFNTFVGTGLSGTIKQEEEIVTITTCEIFKSHPNFKLQIPPHTVLGKIQFTHQDWVYFIPNKGTDLFKVKRENIKSFIKN